ncbi:MAG: hypothetical protein N3F05_03650 [Candidatus Diapherotrites archaeon]|nr:hypothetical protein [Candidatus Diapherotrites archaeon]
MEKHRISLFESIVKSYKQALKEVKEKKNAFIYGEQCGKAAFFSIAPLSRALHDLGLDINVKISYKGIDKNYEIIRNIWAAYERKDSKEGKLLCEFISLVEKNKNGAGFSRNFKRPDLTIEMKKDGFLVNGSKMLPYDANWFRKYDEKKMDETCKKIISEGYALKRRESFSIGFVLVPAKRKIELPLEDHLDSFAIAYHMAKIAALRCKRVVMSSSTERKSKLDVPEPVSDLFATIGACEYEKNIKERQFEIFKKLSNIIGIGKWQYSDASFAIVGSGYHGKHIFGLAVGYPSPDKRTRWSVPGQMFLKPAWHEQSKIDKRPPKTRHQITETIPIEEFIQTCNIDYKKMRIRNIKIKRIIERSDKLIVESEINGKNTNLVVVLKANRRRCEVQRSDSDTRSKIDKEVLKKSGIISGTYDNIPGGEVFFTPKSIFGVAVGDVVINIDHSYVLSSKNPLIVKFSGKKWSLIKAPKKVKKRIDKELADSKKLIKMYEKSGSLPKKIINSYKKNFFGVGEFAINTNPAAKLSRYLIVNEKLANMIHIALGSGFERGTQTVYHWDFVIDVPRQKISIKAIDKNNAVYIIRNGSFVV